MKDAVPTLVKTSTGQKPSPYTTLLTKKHPPIWTVFPSPKCSTDPSEDILQPLLHKPTSLKYSHLSAYSGHSWLVKTKVYLPPKDVPK